MDSEAILTLVIRWIHIVTAMFAIGGAAFACIAFVPACRTALSDEDRAKVADAARARWAKVVHISIALLLLTGGGNFVLLALKAGVKPMPYHALFGLKFLAAMLVFFLASALVGRSPGFDRFRKSPSGPLTTIIITGILIVLLSGVMQHVRLTTPAKTAPDTTASPAP